MVFANLTNTTTYTLTCTGQGGTSSDAVTVTVGSQPQNAPTVNVTANPNYVSFNGTTTINWSSTSATYCTASGNGWSGNKNTSGQMVFANLTNTTTYTLTCTGQGGTSSDAVTVTVGNKQTSAPLIETKSATNITTNYARLNGYLNLNGNSYADVWFAWGTDSNTINQTNRVRHSNNANVDYGLSGLQPNTTYYFVAVAQGEDGVIYGNPQSFLTSGNTNNNTCNYGNCAPTAVTTLATNIGNTSARLNGLGIINGNIATDGYFEWGTTQSLGFSTTTGYIGNSSSTPYFRSLFNLNRNTTYYYRAVVNNQYGTARGDIQSFRTGNTNTTTNTNTIIYRDRIVTTNTNTNTNINTGISKPSLVFLSVNKNGNINGGINNTGGVVRRGEVVDYVIYYKNVSIEQLRDVVLKVSLPKELTFISTTRGYLAEDSNTIVLNIGNLYPQEEGSITVSARVSSTVETGKIIVVTGNVAYTIVSNNNQEEVFAYEKDTIEGGEVLGLQGMALFGSGFWPSSLIGWLILLLILLLIIFVTRMAYNRTRSTVVTNRNGHTVTETTTHN